MFRYTLATHLFDLIHALYACLTYNQSKTTDKLAQTNSKGSRSNINVTVVHTKHLSTPSLDCSQKDTLLHFAVREGLNSLSQHLLSLPGADEAVLQQDSQGQLPIDIAHSQGNEGLAQLLTMYVIVCECGCECMCVHVWEVSV